MQSVPVERAAIALGHAVPQEPIRHARMPLANGGTNVDKAPADLAMNEVVQGHSLHIVAGRLVVDTGYGQFAGTYVGTAQRVFQVFFNNGTEATLLVTTKTLFIYNGAAAQWQPASWLAIHTTTASYAAGATAFALNNVTNIQVNDIVGIVLDDGSELVTTVASIVGTTINTVDAVPVGRTVANGANVYDAINLVGDVTVAQVAIEVFPGNDWIIFCNGIDQVLYYYQGVVQPLPGLPATTSCLAIAVFHEMLLLGNTTESGTHFPHRVRQSDLGAPQTWTPGTGIAAIYNLLDTDDQILVLKTLGPWLICYREQSIMRSTFLGVLNETLYWEYMSFREGAQSQGAVVDVGGEHVFVGINGVYAYKGGYELDSIGDNIFPVFLAAGGDFYKPASATLFCLHVPDYDEVWIFYASALVAPPPLTPTVPNKMWRVQLENNAWFDRTFPDSMVGVGIYVPTSITTWQIAPGQWNSPQWARAWDSRSFTVNVPNVLLCPASGTQLFVYDYATPTDNGTVIDWALITRCFEDAAQFLRWDRAVVTAAGDGIVAQLSTNEGATWTALGTYNFGHQVTSQQVWVYIDKSATGVQLRLNGTDPAFQLRTIDLFYTSDSEW